MCCFANTLRLAANELTLVKHAVCVWHDDHNKLLFCALTNVRFTSSGVFSLLWTIFGLFFCQLVLTKAEAELLLLQAPLGC